MKIKSLSVPLIALVVIAGAAWYLTRPETETLGAPQASGVDAVSIGDISEEQVGQTVAIEGTIEQECPHSGCWAVIDDGTGQIRIDTQKGGFALPLNREGSPIRVVGELESTEGGDLQISAESAEL
ncbi:MAG: hypothetical protein GF393_10375 [Armatimonadia bacterium]|nr:hypothetical protein [Armatimonadia bacterium]